MVRKRQLNLVNNPKVALNVVDRIQKLIRLATNNTFKEEARTAAAEVCRLIVDNNIVVGSSINQTTSTQELEHLRSERVRFTSEARRFANQIQQRDRENGALAHRVLELQFEIERQRGEISQLLKENAKLLKEEQPRRRAAPLPKAPQWKRIVTKYPALCQRCCVVVEPGARVYWAKGAGVICINCGTKEYP